MDVTLISNVSPEDIKRLSEEAQKDWTFFREHSFEVGESTDGDPFISIRGDGESQLHIVRGDGSIDSTTFRTVLQGDGSVVTFWEEFHNGKTTGYGKRVKYADGTQVDISYDANGNETGRSTVKPTPADGATGGSTGGATGGASTSPSPDPSGGSSSTEATTDPSAGASPSTYVNPDADTVGAIRIPTREEIAARVAFLSGIRARFAGRKPELDVTELLPKPGVADPADPACEKSGCVFFVEVSAPRLSNVNGGDPVPPDLKP